GTAFGDEIYAVDGATARKQADPQGVYWTAATDGERQRLELFVPAGIDPASVRLNVDSVSHIVVGLQRPTGDAKALGDSGACEIDVICRANALGSAFTSAKNAVARMVFQTSGGSFTCTGTLLNDIDGNTQIPWFYTAHHCIGTQSEASTLTTFWNYETPTCNVDNAGPNTQVQGGAQLLYSEASTDGAFLRLNNSPPGGAVLLGWNANAMTPQTAVIGIHHPRGDIKKVSQGNHSGISSNVDIDGQILTSALRSSWTEGTTEGGSSGSGLLTFNGGYQLRGGLAGGTAGCSNSGGSEASGNVDFYSRLDLVFPSIQQYLTGQAQNGPSRDYTGQWYLPGEDGRGVSLYAFGNILFGVWFVYDGQGRASWYQLDPQWTGPDVAGGRVVRFTGTPWGPTYNPNDRVLTQVGTFTLTFTSATQATFAYNVDGVNRTITLTKAVVN
ncbi:MAG TPA: trypsin-like peptidase domain-containing protein, partial [Tahibacter sp.]|nr:trypsin-like peptidase domain-containing protein [Tahibacter sp.]